MKTVKFRVVIDLGDKIGTDINVELTNEEYNRILSVKDKPETEQYAELEDILDRVCDETIEREVKYIREDPSLIENYIHDEEDLAQLQEQGYKNFVECLDDAAILNIICDNASFTAKVPELN